MQGRPISQQGCKMCRHRIGLVNRKTILRQQGIQHLHFPIALHLGQNRGCGNRRNLIIATHPSLSRHDEPRGDMLAIDQDPGRHY